MHAEPAQLGRYTLHAELASGGMAAVYLARLAGDAGFARIVAIKRLHPHLAKEEGFVSMFLDEARLAARIVHPNVVATVDVVASHGELFLVMEYVHGETLAAILRTLRSKEAGFIPLPVVSAIITGALAGLHAAHVATDEFGTPLCIVHRDISPQNVMIGVDGVPRVLDFGVAKAAVRLQTTREGQLKGKLAYMAPEQLSGEVTLRTDVYAAGIVLWELITGTRLFPAENEIQLLDRVLHAEIAPPSTVNRAVSPELDRVVMRALSRDPSLRYASALEMAHAVEAVMRPVSYGEVAAWLQEVVGDKLIKKRQQVAEIESGVRSAPPFVANPQRPPGDAADLQSVGAHTLSDRNRGRMRGWPVSALVASFAITCTAGWFLIGARNTATQPSTPAAPQASSQATSREHDVPANDAKTPPVAGSAEGAPGATSSSAKAEASSAPAVSAGSPSAPAEALRAPPAAASAKSHAPHAAQPPHDDLRSLIDSRR